MAALTENQLISTFMRNSDPEGRKVDYVVASTTTNIYKGGFVALNSSGYLEMYVSGVSGTTRVGNRLIGIAMSAVDNSAGADNLTCQVLVNPIFEYALSGAVIGDVGAPVFLSDDNTLSKDAGAGNFLGYIENFVESGIVTVQMQTLDHTHPFMVRVSPTLTHTINHIIPLISPTENHNGLLIIGCWEYITKANTDTVTITIRDTGGTSVGVTLDSPYPSEAGDIIMSDGAVLSATTGDAMTIVPADLGVEAFVTEGSAPPDWQGTAGAGRVIIAAVPIA